MGKGHEATQEFNMSKGILHILLVEDNPADADLLQEVLSQIDGRLQIVHADRLAGAVEILNRAEPVDAILLDLGLPDSRGMATLERLNSTASHLPILILTGQEDELLAIEAVRRGAQDYLVKGQTGPNMLLRAIHHAVERKQGVERVRLLSDVTAQLLASSQPQEIVESLCRKAMKHLNCHAFFNFLVDAKEGRLHLNACAGVSEETAKQIEWLDIGVAVCGCAARDRCRVVAEDIQNIMDPRADLVRSFGIQAYAAHPLMDQDRVIGTLSFGSKSKLRFTEDELDVMKTITDHVAIAMQRIRLMQSLEQHARSAEAANVAKSQFLANISHELRTPMNAIMGMTELALGEDLTPRLRDFLQTAKDSADVLLELLNEILDFSRIETGLFQLESIPFSLRQTIDQTLKTMGLRASEKGLELLADVPDDLLDHYIGDPLRLRQILLNLVGNAIKFTKQGEIVVSVIAAEHSAPTGKNLDSDSEVNLLLQFSVKDTGIGIAAEDQQKVFEPFTQADASMTRSYGGSGLGLAISASLTKMMGGRIWVESKLGEGSTFFFTVSLIPQPDVLGKSEEVLRVLVQLRGLPVLIVSDNQTTRRILEHNLYHLGMVPTSAGDVPSALTKLHAAIDAEKPFALAIIDAIMPQIDGFTLAGWIKHDSRLARATVLMVSSRNRQTYGCRCQELGALCLEKPILQPALFKVISQSLGIDCQPPQIASETAVAVAPAESEQPLRILLAEDNLANQKMALYLLQKWGHGVEITNNGREAVELVSSQDFDLVLMDVQMPIMDGFQATAAIRALADPAKARLPIIAMTAHSMKGDKERCLAAGMDDYLTKPICSQDMFTTFARIRKKPNGVRK
jgi:signal transduction histidine kinase/CheY-like chemotaxis protein